MWVTYMAEQVPSKESLLKRARRNADEIREIIRNHQIIHPTVELVEFFDLVAKHLESESSHEPPGDAEKLLDKLVDAARHQAVKDERFMSYAHECAESDRRAKRTREARAAVLAAMRPTQPPAVTQSDDERSADVIRAFSDALRYRRLRLIGCAPANSEHLSQGLVMRFTNLDGFVDDDIRVHPERGDLPTPTKEV